MSMMWFFVTAVAGISPMCGYAFRNEIANKMQMHHARNNVADRPLPTKLFILWI
jgi:hypothetical protein